METITPEESLLLQCLATTSLLGELSNANFFKSDYFNKLSFANEQHKEILKISGIGNPATMQMMLYALLTVPKEILSRASYEMLESYVERINPLVYSLIEEETSSNYDGETEKENINYFRHIRNAVAHSKCDFNSNAGRNYVTFIDNTPNNSKQCSIKIECYKIGEVIMELQKLIMEYYNNNHKSINS
ncbi:HEPN family nuclease [Clostridium sp.]|uniref:HEPN family nuclease n=1 Tax=Clostridium sp. TaxID=1506 RepID=UPI00263125D7|nr:HEPN family nuclease [Clostridium sp.]